MGEKQSHATVPLRMGDYEAYTVSKENVEDDRALLTSGVIGTGTAVEKQPILDRYTGQTNKKNTKIFC